jgi:biofilm PGA synthesis N-glycosyltransferase PgaC
MTPTYALITSAYNEARFLPDTIASIVAQEIRPVVWMIVSDGSTDDTDRIAREAAEAHDFIRFLRFEGQRPSPHPMGGTAWKKVSAIRAGLAELGTPSWDYFGNIDGDVTFAPDFYATLMQRMEADPSLGIAGGFIYHASEGREWSYFTNPKVVGGPIQFFRRTFWDQVGGYLPFGQEDAIVQMMARMHGWKIQSFSDLRVLHHKTPKEKNRHPLRGRFHTGKMERAMGDHPLYTMAKCVGRLPQRPAVLGSIAHLWGYTWAAFKGIRTDMPPDLVAFNRRQQLLSLRAMLTGPRDEAGPAGSLRSGSDAPGDVPRG